MESLKEEFDKALAAAYRRAAEEADYRSPQYFQMLTRDGGVRTAISLINRSQPSDGYTKLYEKRRLDLTVEAIVVDEPRWHPLFAREIVEKARKRLSEYRYQFKAAPGDEADQGALSLEQNNQAWSRSEVDGCVAAYLEMLDTEISGGTYRKADFNRRVQEVTGRSKGSVEFKFQNVSAVLERLGLRWIDGYKPARNAQVGVIREILEDRLARAPHLADRMELVPPAEAPAVLASLDAVFTDPPPRSEEPQPTSIAGRGNGARRVDWAARDARKRQLGRVGEEFALQAERKWLTTNGRGDLAERVDWVSETQGDGLGYDITSFDLDGTPRLIEVKTTNGDASTPFLVTSNEVEVSRANPETYWLYRVFDFGNSPRIYRQQGPLDDQTVWNASPALYRVSR